MLHRRVMVHTKDGVTTEGVLVGEYADCVALAHPREHVERGEPVALDGDRLIPLVNVSTIDMLPLSDGAVL